MSAEPAPQTKETPEIKAKKKFSELRKKYEEDPKSKTFNALICGEAGTGKTHIAKTCRKPVLVHMFDPGGEQTLKAEIDRGEVIPEIFAPDNPHAPWAFEQWYKTFLAEMRSGIFDHVGTFMLDSSTLWAEAILNFYVAKNAKPGSVPVGNRDYMPQKIQIRNWMNRILSLPCDVIVTGHLEADKDEVTGRMAYRYATTGKGSIMIPAYFSEIYVALADEGPQGMDYKLLTAGAGRYLARTRLGSGKLLDTYEKPNIKGILEKAGYPTEDKPLHLE